MDQTQSNSQPPRFRGQPRAFWKATSSSKPGTPYTKPSHAQSSSSARPSAETNPPFVWQDYVSPGTAIQYLRDTEAANTALESVKGPFGFDIEWKPQFIKGGPESPIALIQLARPDQIFLIQVTAMDEFPDRLRDVLEDREIVKAGVGISGDAEKLWRDYGVSLLATVELSQFARAADSPRWESAKAGKWIALARLLEAYTSRQLVKTKKIRISNWEASLDARQLDYAASDALAGFIIYQHLLNLESGAPARDYTHNYIGGQRRPYVCPDPISLRQDPLSP